MCKQLWTVQFVQFWGRFTLKITVFFSCVWWVSGCDKSCVLESCRSSTGLDIDTQITLVTRRVLLTGVYNERWYRLSFSDVRFKTSEINTWNYLWSRYQGSHHDIFKFEKKVYFSSKIFDQKSLVLIRWFVSLN